MRIGVDLVSVATVEESIARHADRYLSRVYTDGELAECRDANGLPVAERLAARFAAKEATLKILRRNDEPIPWRDISIASDRFGVPSLELFGRARAAASRCGVRAIDVSLSHEQGLVAAVVVADMESAT